jgi:hypothetical protein
MSSEVISTVRGSVRAAINSKESNTCLTGAESNDIDDEDTDAGDAIVLPVDIVAVVPCSAVVVALAVELPS